MSSAGHQTWQEWEKELNDGDSSDSVEEDYSNYRQQVNKETPNLILDEDIKSEVLTYAQNLIY